MTEEQERQARLKLDCIKIAAHDVLAWSALTTDSVFKVAKLIEAHVGIRAMDIFEFKATIADVDYAIANVRKEDDVAAVVDTQLKEQKEVLEND